MRHFNPGTSTWRGMAADVQDYLHFGRKRRPNHLSQFFRGLLAPQVKIIFPRFSCCTFKMNHNQFQHPRLANPHFGPVLCQEEQQQLQ